MKMSVIGCGYLGAVHAASMVKLGHEVVGIDVDNAKIEALAAGQSPIYEPGLPELLVESVGSGLEPLRRREATRQTFSLSTQQFKGCCPTSLKAISS
jgi:UDP-glucose 6-dehydrogenase